MCGICGVLSFSDTPVDRSVVDRMIANLRHRGPDGTASFARGRCSLGHARLAIIDPQGGRQPMFNEDESVAVTFNGEIYNFKELRGTLTAAGHRFRTESDSEVIVHAWEEWGRECVRRFRGMFAFAVADWNRRRMFLARDHLGIKPLYYALGKDSLRFASEPGAIKEALGFDTSVDYVAIDQYLHLGYIPAPRTAYATMAKLAPGTGLEVSFDGESTGPWRYWRVDFRPDTRPSRDEWLERVDAAVRESVGAHLVSDVPFGAFLSGGLDSTLVVRYMSELLKEPVRSFSIGFTSKQYDESEFAQSAAARFGTRHEMRRVEPEVTVALDALVGLYGEPFGDASAIPTYHVSRLARASVPMVLSGDGGDEGFGGYARYRGWVEGRHRMSSIARLRRWVRQARSRYGEGGGAVQRGSAQSLDWLFYVRQFEVSERRDLWKEEFRPCIGHEIELFEDAVRNRTSTPSSALGQLLDYSAYLPEDVMRKVDVASMAHGLEVRTPLVDVRLVELITQIPSEFTVAAYDGSGWRSKPLLRDLLVRWLDPGFVNRPKQGFELPIRQWLSTGGELRSWAEQLVLSDDSLIHGFLRREAIGRVFEELDAGRGHASKVWQLVCLEKWMRHSKGVAH